MLRLLVFVSMFEVSAFIFGCFVRIGAVRGADVARVNMELSNVELTTLQRIILVPLRYSRGALSVTASPTHKFGWTSFTCSLPCAEDSSSGSSHAVP